MDGVAVLNATMDDDTWKPFADRTRYCENWIYEPDLVRFSEYTNSFYFNF